MNFKMIKVWLCANLLCSGGLTAALQINAGDREFTVSTASLSAVVRDGEIIEVRDLKSHQIWADAQKADRGIPAGLGILFDLDAFRKGHVPWGDPTLRQELSVDFPLVNYFRPNEKSTYQLRQEAGGLVAIWKGLSNGKTFLADATLTLKMSEGVGGILEYQLIGESSDGGVFGLSCPIVNIDKQAEVIVPSFGGMGYKGDGAPALIPLGGAPFMEASVILAQKGGKSLAIWMEDPTMRSFYAFIRRSSKTFSLTLESLALMPFESQKELSTPVFKLQVFDGDWKTAATPYRNWYQEHFKKEIATRDGVSWVSGIRTIIDTYMTIPSDTELEKISKLFPEGSVMFQVWNARAAHFDTELPDWTPREGYADGVKRLHENGFKAMAYVNTYCGNYQSPVWQRDKLSDFVLTRKNGFWTYKGKSIASTDATMSEKLIGTVDYADGPDQFANMQAGRLLYTDPLSSRWRHYHADMMKWWNTTTGTDANYEDTAGCVADGGNGIVDGLSAGEGSVAQMQLLQETQPNVAMSSEYGPAGIAFATSWALNYVGHWGHDEFKRYRINHQYPLTTYLYGYRQWVSSMMSSDGMRCHAMTATSDATGGLGFSMDGYFYRKSLEEIESNYDWAGHLFQRARIFANERLTPYYPEGNYPENIRCLYKGDRGIFSYYDDGQLQQMLDPNGVPLYGRAFNATRIATDLWLDNWPLQNGKEIFGLNPKTHYPLFVKPVDAQVCALSVESLPDRVVLNKYYDGANYAYFELGRLSGGPAEISLDLKTNKKFSKYYANGVPVEPAKIQAKLPLRLVGVTAPAGQAFGASIGENPPNREIHNIRGRSLFLQNGKGEHSDFVVEVPTKDSALEFYLRNLQDKYPFHGFDGSIVKVLINGVEVKSYDCLPSPKENPIPDTNLRRWLIPLGQYVGETVLVSIETDFKENPVQDRQFVGVPTLVKDLSQTFQERIFDGGFKVVRNVGAPDSWGGGTTTELDGAKLLEGTGIRVAEGGYTIDPSKTYRLSGKFKARESSTKGNLLFGLAPHDRSLKPISATQVNPVKCTDTVLADDALTGSTKIKVKNASSWKSGEYMAVAFNARPDFGDLPNRELIQVTKIEKDEIFLKEPIKSDYPAGTGVREHVSGNSYMYSGAAYQNIPSDKWVECSGEISGEAAFGLANDRWWKGTEMVRILMIASQPDIMFKDVRLDEIE